MLHSSLFKNRSKFLAFLVLLLGLSDLVQAQAKPHAVRFSLKYTPANLSRSFIYRVDSFNEDYKVDTRAGVGVGYSYTLFPFLKANLDLYYTRMSGLDHHSGKNMDFNEFSVELGPELISGTNPQAYFGLAFQWVKTTTDDYYDWEEVDNVSGRGVILGTGVRYRFTPHSAIQAGIRANGRVINFRPRGTSFQITQEAGYYTELSISYLYRF